MSETDLGKALTALAVEKMQPGTARREVPDGLVSGLYLIVQPSGARSWAVRYRSGGVTRKHTLGAWPGIDLKAARELAQRALIDVAMGGDPGVAKKAARAAEKVPNDRDLFERAVETFIERYAKANTRESSWRETERILKREAVSVWQGKRLKDIGRADVHDMLDGIMDRGTPIMANRTLAAVRKLFSWAVERGLVEASPCEKLKAPAVARSRDRVLTEEELRQVWTACDGLGWPFGPMFKLLMLTGQRRDEVGSMRWNEVDLAKRIWTIPRNRAKNNVEHIVPLSDQAAAILAELPHIGDEFVFTTTGRTAATGFSKAKKRVDRTMVRKGLDGGEISPPTWTLHDLRRTTATGMARLGISLPVIEKVLNHVSGSFGGIVGVYNRHSFQEEKRAALQAWGGYVERLVAGDGNVLRMVRSAS